MSNRNVLILCTGNSCRSQMAEAIWNRLAGASWRAVSAGTQPAGYVHPLALAALAEKGLPHDGLTSKSIPDKDLSQFDLIVTVCGSAAQTCPRPLTSTPVLHWPFDDPARATGVERERMTVFRRVRDQIQWRIRQYLEATGACPTNRDITPVFDDATRRDAAAIIERAFQEDLGPAAIDITSAALVPADALGTAVLAAREAGVACGVELVAQVAARMGKFTWEPLVMDGERVVQGQTIGVMRGDARTLLAAERVCLNLVGRLSGIATLTRSFVDKMADSGAALYDTRKTTPGWRRLEKYAVTCGGGRNHRLGLYDAILIKDNHLTWLRTQGDDPGVYLPSAIRAAREWIARHTRELPHGGETIVQIEVDRWEQLPMALAHQPDLILLDNFSLSNLAKAVALRNAEGSRTLLEASGGVTLETVAAVAATGVERVSAGAITHSARCLDVALDWEPPIHSHSPG